VNEEDDHGQQDEERRTDSYSDDDVRTKGVVGGNRWYTERVGIH
jgi:hypothetical protein